VIVCAGGKALGVEAAATAVTGVVLVGWWLITKGALVLWSAAVAAAVVVAPSF
jgi:hypothetical protein